LEVEEAARSSHTSKGRAGWRRASSRTTTTILLKKEVQSTSMSSSAIRAAAGALRRRMFFCSIDFKNGTGSSLGRRLLKLELFPCRALKESFQLTAGSKFVRKTSVVPL
jgi:hypothetical protein